LYKILIKSKMKKSNKTKKMNKKIFLIFCMILLLTSLSLISSKNFKINSSLGNLFFVNGTSGYVGVGTDSPSYKLDISGKLHVSDDLTISGSDIYEDGGHLRLNGEDNVYISMDYNNDDADTNAIIFGKNDEGGDTHWEELMRLSEEGNLNVSGGDIYDESGLVMPEGIIMTFIGAECPIGYLNCNGTSYSRTAYSDLYSAIGIIYGNNSDSDFKVPDYRGYFLRGWDQGAGNDPNAASRTDRGDGTTGDYVGTKQGDEFESHVHSVNPPSTTSSSDGAHTHSVNPPSTSTSSVSNHRHSYTAPSLETGIGDGLYCPEYTRTSTYTGYAGGHSHTVDIASFTSGSNGAHTHTVDIAAFDSASAGGSETRPKNINVLYCMKY
jgi:microcystin-dependent protein